MTELRTFSRNATRAAIVLVSSVIGLSGCVAAAVHSSTYAAKAAPRDGLLPSARAGDAIAQYELGKSYCCMGPGFDTQTSTEWLCKAAHQHNADAMYELGRIYLGDISRSAAPGQKLRAMAAQTSPSHAYFWLSRAASANHSDAQTLLADLGEDINEADLDAARQLATRWPNVACEYDEVLAN